MCDWCGGEIGDIEYKSKCVVGKFCSSECYRSQFKKELYFTASS